MSVTTDLRDALERLTLLLRADDRRTPGLLPTHRALLRYLSRANRYSDTPGAASRYLGQTKGTVSQSLRVLERRGLVRKESDPGDRRRVRLRLTARARRLLARHPDGAAAALAQVPATEAPAVRDTVARLLDLLQAATGGPRFGTCGTCRWFAAEAGGPRCGLTRDALAPEETDQLCGEYERRVG